MPAVGQFKCANVCSYNKEYSPLFYASFRGYSWAFEKNYFLCKYMSDGSILPKNGCDVQIVYVTA